MFKNIPFHRVNWKTSIFLMVTTLISFTAVPWYIWKYGLDLFQVSMFFFYVVATIMSITLGYHRLFSHLSFKAKWPVKFLTLVFGAAAFENSCLSWASDHRHHHKHCDHEGDPYDISNGFFYAHIGWLLFKLDPMPVMDNVKDLQRDKMVMWQDKWVHLIAVISGIILPTGLTFAFAGYEAALGVFLITGFLRIVVVQHCTFFINSLCHMIGTRPYNSDNSARDSAIMAFFTCGEGYHNYHHSFQHDYRNGVKPWQFDPTKWMIWTLSKFGLTSSLRTVADEKILLAEVREANRLLDKKRGGMTEVAEAAPFQQRAEEMIEVLSDRLAECCTKVEESVANKVQLSREALVEIQTEIHSVVKGIGKDLKHIPVRSK